MTTLVHSRPAVVLGLSPTGLYAVRELGRAGVSVAGVSSGRQCGSYSRYLTLGAFAEADEGRRLERLLALSQAANEQPVLIPASDQDIDFIVRHAARLSQHFVFQRSYADGLAATIMAKRSVYALCREHGIETPQSWEMARGDILTLAGDISYPCIVKPSRIDLVKAQMAGRKLWVATSQADFRTIAAALPEGDTTWIVQEMIPGPESAITLYAAYIDRDGNFRQAITCRKLRQYPPGFGSASLVRSATEPETREISETFIHNIGYRGIASTEFKRDPRDGRLKFIEMNPRPSLWFAVTGPSGKQITAAAYRDLSDLPALPEDAQRDDVQWRYWLKDMYSKSFYAMSRGFPLPPPVVPASGTAAHRLGPIYAADDPRPAIGETLNFGSKFVRRVTAMMGKR